MNLCALWSWHLVLWRVCCWNDCRFCSVDAMAKRRAFVMDHILIALHSDSGSDGLRGWGQLACAIKTSRGFLLLELFMTLWLDR